METKLKNRRSIKKIIAWLMCIAMVFAMLPGLALADCNDHNFTVWDDIMGDGQHKMLCETPGCDEFEMQACDDDDDGACSVCGYEAPWTCPGAGKCCEDCCEGTDECDVVCSCIIEFDDSSDFRVVTIGDDFFVTGYSVEDGKDIDYYLTNLNTYYDEVKVEVGQWVWNPVTLQYDFNKVIIADSDYNTTPLGSGMIITLYDDAGEVIVQKTKVVKYDLTGNGTSDQAELIMLARHILHMSMKDESQLNDAQLLAIDKHGVEFSIIDMLLFQLELALIQDALP